MHPDEMHPDEAVLGDPSVEAATASHAVGAVRQPLRERVLRHGADLRRKVVAPSRWRPRRRDLLRWLPRHRRRHRRVPLSDVVDRGVFNAVGFDPDHNGVVIDVGDLAGQMRRPARLVRRVHRARAVRFERAVHGAPSMLELGLAGAVLVGHQPGPDADPLAVAASRDVASLDDSSDRELHSIDIRRQARRILGANEVRPSISVLLATNRPVHLERSLQSIARQSIAAQEVLIGMHGPHWSERHAAIAREMLGDAARIDYFDEALPLGSVLQALTHQATGELATKWDDDDWYGAHHLEDLADALDDSGADLVGKAAEFVNLERMDLTIRRFADGAEQYSNTVAGGTLMLRTSTLRAVGGWAAVPRHVDRRLIDAVRRSGGLVYRTHGFEYLLRRAGSGHTWSVDDEYFLAQASEVRAGLDLEMCGIDV